MGISTTIPSQDNDEVALWPALPYHAWQDTRETLHMWTQIVGKLQTPAFFAYTSPEPPGCREAVIRPDPAFFHPDLSEFILLYDDVRGAAASDQLIMDFFESTYAIGATLGGWDRAALERVTSIARGGQTAPR